MRHSAEDLKLQLILSVNRSFGMVISELVDFGNSDVAKSTVIEGLHDRLKLSIVTKT